MYYKQVINYKSFRIFIIKLFLITGSQSYILPDDIASEAVNGAKPFDLDITANYTLSFPDDNITTNSKKNLQ